MSSQERTKGSLIKKQGRHLQAITCEPRRKLCKQVSVWPTFFVKICFSTLYIFKCVLMKTGYVNIYI